MRIRNSLTALIVLAVLAGCALPGTPVAEPTGAAAIQGAAPTAVALPTTGNQGGTPAVSGPTPLQPQPTQAAQPTPGEPDSAAIVDDQGRLLFARAADLTKLGSYRAHHTWAYKWAQGGSGATEISVEWVREPYAERVTITRDGKTSSRQELVRVSDVTYMLMAEGWQTMRSAAALFPPEADPRLGLLPYVAGSTAEPVGDEVLDGMAVKHFRYKADELTLGDYYTQTAAASADVWVSMDLGVFVKAQLHWEGSTPDLGQGSFDLTVRVTDIDQPIVIQPPTDAAAPEVPEDIVLTRDASSIAIVDKAIYYQTNSAPSEVADYYKVKMPALGWTIDSDSRDAKSPEAAQSFTAVVMEFSKGDRLLKMSAQPGPPSLVVMVQASKATPAAP